MKAKQTLNKKLLAFAFFILTFFLSYYKIKRARNKKSSFFAMRVNNLARRTLGFCVRRNNGKVHFFRGLVIELPSSGFGLVLASYLARETNYKTIKKTKRTNSEFGLRWKNFKKAKSGAGVVGERKGTVLMDSFAFDLVVGLFEADFPGGRHRHVGVGKVDALKSTNRCATKCNQRRDTTIKAKLKLLRGASRFGSLAILVEAKEQQMACSTVNCDIYSRA